MSDHDAALRTLCEACGVATGYHEISGRWIETPRAALVALLAALGVRAASAADCDAERERLERVRWQTLLEPVNLIEAGCGGPAAGLRLPDTRLDSSLRWRLGLESGESREGRVRVGDLPVSETHTIDGECVRVRWLHVGDPLPPGYHRLEIAPEWNEAPREALVVSAPVRCWRPDGFDDGARAWGLAVQLYALRSSRNWGIGDFGDLARLADFAAGQGADLIGLNPLHALFPEAPERASPYSPSSRCWLNPVYIEVEAVPEVRDDASIRARIGTPAFRERLAALRSGDLVDHAGVVAVKFEVLREAWRRFVHVELEPGAERGRAFLAFRARGGRELRLHALFEAIQARCHAENPSVCGWPAWPEPLRDPASPAVSTFESEHADEVGFREYLQWLAATQLAGVADHCAALGMRIGLYRDLAVSVDGGGSDAWIGRGLHALGIGIGAPPDDFNRQGQDWGLPPPVPERSRALGHAPFIRALRANMRAAGALRIDHVMQLMRLFWVPRGLGAAQGGYVGYPLDELAAIVALESHRNRCLVIGEDLGTVPDPVRRMMARRGVLAYRLLYFERAGDGGFRSAHAFERDALVAASTHDLPTLAGWWSGEDIGLREVLGLLPPEFPPERLRIERERDRQRLLVTVGRDLATIPALLEPALNAAIHAHLASSPCCLMTVQLEDLLASTGQANLPGTVDVHPNWRRRLPVAVEAIEAVPGVREILAAVAARRGRREGG
ncbi:MAG: hypothetical protein RIS35_1029 [Pseudomonadota bacterium]|jgi:(1->4)-alpha-D-glucan 1-alpha-D-glucosylmutase